MKSRTLVTTGGVLLLIVAGVMLLLQSEEARPFIEAPRTIQAMPRSAMKNDHGSASQPKSDAEPVARDAKLPDEEMSAILNTIEQASVTYNAKALPLIEPYLLHPEPQVRLAAMNGMIVLGEAAAGPLLRKAAENSPNPKEAVALAEAADFVELPSGTFVPRDRTSPGTRKPLGAEPAARARLRPTPSAKPESEEDPTAPVE